MLNILTLILIAISLSMDTFSLSIIYGTLISSKKILLLSILVGLFHFFMPLIGNGIGSSIFDKIPVSSSIIVGCIFIIISIEMLLQKSDVYEYKNLFSFILFSFTVSIDSFSVGIGLSAITKNYFLAYIIFCIISGIFTFFGLKFGNKLSKKYGRVSTIIGSILLMLFGIYYILN